jgi:hypothetical protein
LIFCITCYCKIIFNKICGLVNVGIDGSTSSLKFKYNNNPVVMHVEPCAPVGPVGPGSPYASGGPVAPLTPGTPCGPGMPLPSVLQHRCDPK